MANTITRFGCAADGREAIRGSSRFPSSEGCSSRRKEAHFKIPKFEMGKQQSLLTSAGRFPYSEGGSSRFPSWEGSGAGRFLKSPLSNSEFRILNSEFDLSLLTSAELPGGCSAGVLACECTGRPARCSCWRRDAAATRSRDGCATRLMSGCRFPSREGSGVGWFVHSPLFLSDL